MRAIILVCKPYARFHFGGIAPDENAWLNTSDEWLHSDTLFSAIVNIAAEVYSQSEVEEMLYAFNKGDIRISSGFYVLTDSALSSPIFFLPKPLHYSLELPSLNDWEESKKYKDLNKVRLISKRVWEAGWNFNEWNENCYFIQNGIAVVAKEELPSFQDDIQAKRIYLWRQENYPRVKVHTTEKSESFFHITTTVIGENSSILKNWNVHFYFLIDVKKEFEETKTFKRIQTAIRMLPFRGIGGERSIGCGQIEGIIEHDFSLSPTFETTLQCSISVISPSQEDMLIAQYYGILSRGGRRYGGQHKRFLYVRMMSEGSIFKGKPEGTIPIIGRNLGHDVRRYGKSFCLPVRQFS